MLNMSKGAYMNQWMDEIAANGPAGSGVVGTVPSWEGPWSSTPRPLKAGPLSAELADGCLRDVRYGGIDILRSMAFVARDGQGDRCVHGAGELSLRERAGRFEAFYETVVGCEELRLA